LYTQFDGVPGTPFDAGTPPPPATTPPPTLAQQHEIDRLSYNLAVVISNSNFKAYVSTCPVTRVRVQCDQDGGEATIAKILHGLFASSIQYTANFVGRGGADVYVENFFGGALRDVAESTLTADELSSATITVNAVNSGAASLVLSSALVVVALVRLF